MAKKENAEKKAWGGKADEAAHADKKQGSEKASHAAAPDIGKAAGQKVEQAKATHPEKQEREPARPAHPKPTNANMAQKPVAQQAEVNIGMVGHVDHGKCIALDSPILLNSELSNGTELLQKAGLSGTPQRVSGSETLFENMPLKAFSLSPNFELTSVPAKLFTQNYSGKMVEVKTKRGKRITISPRHPLLVNNGKELVWVEGKDLKPGHAIAALRSIPDQEFIRDFASDWKEKLGKKCWIVTKKEFAELREKTLDFSQFESLNLDELNKLRILAKHSFLGLERKACIIHGAMASAVKAGKISTVRSKAVCAVLKNLAFEEPGEIIINYKANTKSFCKVNTTDQYSDDALRFLAFVIAEGCIHNASVRFSQEANEMLGEMKRICQELFSEQPAFYKDFDHQISSKALTCFLEERYGLRHGNSRESGIPEWVFSLPKRKIAVFLNWFFTLEGNFDLHSGQIALAQANRRSICVISYALKKFGISHSVHDMEKYAANTEKKTRRTYWQLIISGIENIARFEKEIGVSLQQKALTLRTLGAKKQAGKRSDEMVPLDFKLLSELVRLLGWKKNSSAGFGKLRSMEWFFAYNDCVHKNAISRKNLGIFVKSCGERLNELSALRMADAPARQIMAKAAISQNEVAKKLGITPKVMFRMLKRENGEEMGKVDSAIHETISCRIAAAQELLGKIRGNSPDNIEWDKIRAIKEIDYTGPIMDLQVPGYHNFVAGLGGIVSHNTSLVQTLTGKWTDTHSEEIKKGISIRLGYADTVFYKCDLTTGSEAYNCTGKCAEGMGMPVQLRRVSFVDAPGHETLMATMLSGAALMNGAVLVVAANEKCPQPRTAEHLMALSISGVKNIVVAQNKIDLVDRKRAIESSNEISSFLKDYGYAGAPIIPISANLKLNIDMLIEAIENTIPSPKLEKNKEFRMHVVRSFDVNKPGTKPEDMVGGVLGGSIIAGTLKVGDKIEISPGDNGKPMQAEVVSLGVEGGRLSEACAGGLIAVGTKLDPFYTKNDEMRGQLVARPGTLPAPVTVVRMEVKPLERLLVGRKEAELKVNDFVVLAIGTSTAIGQVARLAGKGEFEFRLRTPVVVEKGMKVAISKKETSGWRLRAYGICK